MRLPLSCVVSSFLSAASVFSFYFLFFYILDPASRIIILEVQLLAEVRETALRRLPPFSRTRGSCAGDPQNAGSAHLFRLLHPTHAGFEVHLEALEGAAWLFYSPVLAGASPLTQGAE